MLRFPKLSMLAAGGLGLSFAGCTPTVQVVAPSEPIVINMNIKIEHELRIRVEKDVEDLFSDNEDLFGESE